MSNDYSDIHIESSMPKPWEEEETFNDVLYEWMSKAPWLLISGALHVVAAFILAAIPWSSYDPPEEKSFTAQMDAPPEEIDEEIEEPETEIEETETEVLLEEFEVSDHNETDTDEPYESSDGTEGLADSPFEASNTNSAIGIGGGAGGKYGGRGGGNANKRAGGKKYANIQAGLKWLKDHQDEDGKWDCDDFMKHDPEGDKTEGAGDSAHDVGVTALALLAFLGDGHSMNDGKYSDVVKRGVNWLLDQQDRENGLIGDRVAHDFLYDHAIATLALCEVVNMDKSASVKRKAKKAVEFIAQSRNPYRVWRYASPPDGENDTSVTGWMVFALKSAQEGGINIGKDAFTSSIEWFDEMTDPGTGRCGYIERGSPSSRVRGVNMEGYPVKDVEALTAVSLLCRFFLGQTPEDTDLMNKHADLLLKSLPKWSDDGSTNDMYYWYYGSYAMYQMDGKYWKAWEKAMKPAMVDTQRQDGSSKGSWDPNGPWGHSGGRVYSTATMVLCLESYYRYGRVLGAR